MALFRMAIKFSIVAVIFFEQSFRLVQGFTPRISQLRKLSILASSSSTEENDITSSLFAPPPYLQDLKVGDSIQPIDKVPILTITRIALNPPIYVFRNVLHLGEDRKSLMNACQQMGMKPAETKLGVVSAHRSHSHVAWLSAADHGVAELMTHLNRELFVNNGVVFSEDVQVVRYNSGGRFDLHHDGFDRIVTVLHYLNGVGGTWFPFCKIDDTTSDDNDEPPPRMTMMNPSAMTSGKRPGSDGVWIVGSENSQPASPHVIPVNPGDAIAFYNYEETHVDGSTRAAMNWRSLHAGMSTNQDKWIATNWFRPFLEDQEDE